MYHTTEKDTSLETVTKKLQYGSIVAFTVKNFPDSHRGALNLTPWIYQDKLWIHSVLAHPPKSILLTGKLFLDGYKIDLDTSGMAQPWASVDEFSVSDARLVRHKIHNSRESPSFYYILKIAFIKGGAEDYIATWKIYKNKSLRMSVEGLGDSPICWGQNE